MKHILKLVVVIILALSLVGCAEGQPPAGGGHEFDADASLACGPMASAIFGECK